MLKPVEASAELIKQRPGSAIVAALRGAIRTGGRRRRVSTAGRRTNPRLVKDAKQKIFLIVDNLRVHHAKAVQDWLARHKDEIEIFYLPAYAPEHNPD